MKRKKKVEEEIHVKKEIIRSVFDPPFVSTAASGGVVSCYSIFDTLPIQSSSIGQDIGPQASHDSRRLRLVILCRSAAAYMC